MRSRIRWSSASSGALTGKMPRISSKCAGAVIPKLSVCTFGVLKQKRAFHWMGVSGAVSSLSSFEGLYRRPPLSLGEMMNTPMSFSAARSTAGSLRCRK
jgi:hypothetical protein